MTSQGPGAETARRRSAGSRNVRVGAKSAPPRARAQAARASLSSTGPEGAVRRLPVVRRRHDVAGRVADEQAVDSDQEDPRRATAPFVSRRARPSRGRRRRGAPRPRRDDDGASGGGRRRACPPGAPPSPSRARLAELPDRRRARRGAHPRRPRGRQLLAVDAEGAWKRRRSWARHTTAPMTTSRPVIVRSPPARYRMRPRLEAEGAAAAHGVPPARSPLARSRAATWRSPSVTTNMRGNPGARTTAPTALSPAKRSCTATVPSDRRTSRVCATLVARVVGTRQSTSPVSVQNVSACRPPRAARRGRAWRVMPGTSARSGGVPQTRRAAERDAGPFASRAAGEGAVGLGSALIFGPQARGAELVRLAELAAERADAEVPACAVPPEQARTSPWPKARAASTRSASRVRERVDGAVVRARAGGRHEGDPCPVERSRRARRRPRRACRRLVLGGVERLTPARRAARRRRKEHGAEVERAPADLGGAGRGRARARPRARRGPDGGRRRRAEGELGAEGEASPSGRRRRRRRARPARRSAGARRRRPRARARALRALRRGASPRAAPRRSRPPRGCWRSRRGSARGDRARARSDRAPSGRG